MRSARSALVRSVVVVLMTGSTSSGLTGGRAVRVGAASLASDGGGGVDPEHSAQRERAPDHGDAQQVAHADGEAGRGGGERDGPHGDDHVEQQGGDDADRRRGRGYNHRLTEPASPTKEERR